MIVYMPSRPAGCQYASGQKGKNSGTSRTSITTKMGCRI